MNAEYIFDIFKTTEDTKSADLTIGLAKLEVDKPIPEDVSRREIIRFITRHYDALCEAYAKREKEHFCTVAEELMLEDEAEQG